MNAVTVEIEPWPEYPDRGGNPIWNVRVTTEKSSRRLKWSAQFDRFVRSESLMRLRRGEPVAHRLAASRMRKFCAGSGAPMQVKP